jgi:hypothetical protein
MVPAINDKIANECDLSETVARLPNEPGGKLVGRRASPSGYKAPRFRISGA